MSDFDGIKLLVRMFCEADFRYKMLHFFGRSICLLISNVKAAVSLPTPIPALPRHLHFKSNQPHQLREAVKGENLLLQ